MQVMNISELKKSVPGAMRMEDYVTSLKEDEPTVILRDFDYAPSSPSMDAEVELFDFANKPRPADDVARSYGTRPDVSGIEVINAIKNALGPGGYQLHISDASYTGYSIWELKEYMSNFDGTNLKVWIEETFDCDDFSAVLQGNVNNFFPGIAFGTIWYGPKKPPIWGHSVNIFYSYTDKKVYLVEPQADTFYFFNKDKWKAWMVMM
jgi:hypothetical protein